MKLGKYFTLEELIVTKTNLLNVPNQSQILALSGLVNNILDPVRELYAKPINVNSGFRSQRVNDATPNASHTSQHIKGEAADLDNDIDNAKLFYLIRDNFVFDQLIWEHGDDKNPAWVHVSYKTQGNRGEVLKTVGKKYIRL